MHTILLLGLASLITGIKSYVSLQVSKTDNQSNMDALIHKVVSPEQFEKIADRMSNKRYDTVNVEKDKIRPLSEDNIDRENDNVILAINPGDSSSEEAPRAKSHRTHNTGTHNVNDNGNPKNVKNGKSNGLFNIGNLKSELVNFRSGYPSLVYELNSKNIIKFITDLLSSANVEKYTDQLVKKVRVIARTIKKEMKD